MGLSSTILRPNSTLFGLVSSIEKNTSYVNNICHVQLYKVTMFCLCDFTVILGNSELTYRKALASYSNLISLFAFRKTKTLQFFYESISRLQKQYIKNRKYGNEIFSWTYTSANNDSIKQVEAVDFPFLKKRYGPFCIRAICATIQYNKIENQDKFLWILPHLNGIHSLAYLHFSSFFAKKKGFLKKGILKMSCKLIFWKIWICTIIKFCMNIHFAQETSIDYVLIKLLAAISNCLTYFALKTLSRNQLVWYRSLYLRESSRYSYWTFTNYQRKSIF